MNVFQRIFHFMFFFPFIVLTFQGKFIESTEIHSLRNRNTNARDENGNALRCDVICDYNFEFSFWGRKNRGKIEESEIS